MLEVKLGQSGGFGRASPRCKLVGREIRKCRRRLGWVCIWSAFTPRIFLPSSCVIRFPFLTFACQVQLRKDRPIILNTNVRQRYKPDKLRLSMLARQRSNNRNNFRGLHGHVVATLPGNSPVVSSHRSKTRRVDWDDLKHPEAHVAPLSTSD